jgi:hypothetical protein
MSIQFFLKDQLLTVAAAWGFKDFELPKKGTLRIISRPKGQSPNVAFITRSEKKSTYGKPLFQCEFKTI